MDIGKIWLDALVVGDRLRQVDAARVDALAESMDAIGLQQPVSVWFDDEEAMHLVAGLHRVRAAEKLGWEQIDAVTVDMDQIDRDLWEIDENLCRSELTEAQEAQHLARRKELWTARENRVAQVEPPKSLSPQKKGFAADTASATGQSKATVNRKIARAEAIAPDVLKEITGSRWDKGVVLDILKKLTHAEQRQSLFRVKSGTSSSFEDAYEFIKGDKPTERKPVQPPAAPLNDQEVFNSQLARLISAWNGAGKDVRQHFIETYIDTPIMEAGQPTGPFASAAR